MTSNRTILITGVTGNQGGAVAQALQGTGFHLRGLTRKPDSERAAALARHGVDIVKGDLDDEATLRRALAGAWGVFGVQNAGEAGVEREEAQGKRLATLAREAGVEHYVYTSVGSAHKRTGVPHFDNKWRIEETVRGLRFPSHVILRPVFFMENLLAPFSLQGSTLAWALGPGTKLQMIAVDDIGWFGARAFTDAAALNRREIDLAGDVRTMPEAAEILTEALGRPIAFAQTPIEQVRQYSKDMALMLRMVRARRLQRRHRWPGTRVRPRAHEAPRLGTPPRATKWADSRRARMKAVRLLEYGGQLVFNDVPTPTIARDEILVKIKSTAVNHLDLVEASGTARQILPIDLPWIPGHEFSGVVEQIGSDVAACAPGDAVFGTTTGMGAYAEYLAVKAAAIARKPSNLSFEEAASVPVASQTAWQGIFTHGHLEKGQTILIHGGAGAVGAYAVQLASHAGATVIATASGDDEAYLNSIGASRVIDYREAQFEKVLREKVDVVFDLIGGDTQKRSFLVLKEGGHLVSATQPVSQEETARHRVSGAMMRLAPSGDVLGRIARLLEEGTIRPDVATVYALQDAAQAWKDIAGNLPGVHGMSPSGPGAARRRSHGKIVLRVA